MIMSTKPKQGYGTKLIGELTKLAGEFNLALLLESARDTDELWKSKFNFKLPKDKNLAIKVFHDTTLLLRTSKAASQPSLREVSESSLNTKDQHDEARKSKENCVASKPKSTNKGESSLKATVTNGDKAAGQKDITKVKKLNFSAQIWKAQLARLATYKVEHGDCSVPQSWAEDPRLGTWVSKQRALKRRLDRGEPSEGMTAERVALLTALGFVWEFRRGSEHNCTRQREVLEKIEALHVELGQLQKSLKEAPKSEFPANKLSATQIHDFVGHRVCKTFAGHGAFEGTVTQADRSEEPAVYVVLFDDGDREEMKWDELRTWLLETKYAGKTETLLPAEPMSVKVATGSGQAAFETEWSNLMAEQKRSVSSIGFTKLNWSRRKEYIKLKIWSDLSHEQQFAAEALGFQQSDFAADGSSGSLPEDRSPKNIGDVVEVNCNSKGHWYPGEIIKVNQDGTVDIKYSDGAMEPNVKHWDIRAKLKRRRAAVGSDAKTRACTGLGRKAAPGSWSDSSSDDSDEEEVAFIPSQILEKEVRGGVTYYSIEWEDNKGASWVGASDVDGDAAFRTVLREFNRQAEARQPARQGGDTGKTVKATQSKRGGAGAAKQVVPAQVPVASSAAPNAFGNTKCGRRANVVDYNESSLCKEQRPMYRDFAGNDGQGPVESGAQYRARQNDVLGVALAVDVASTVAAEGAAGRPTKSCKQKSSESSSDAMGVQSHLYHQTLSTMGKKKDPNAPKRGMNAFIFYSCNRRPQLKTQNPDWGFDEFGKAIGAEWGQMNEKQKAKYTKKAEKDKMRFDREMENYDPPSEEEPAKGKRKKKDPNAPKRVCASEKQLAVTRRREFLKTVSNTDELLSTKKPRLSDANGQTLGVEKVDVPTNPARLLADSSVGSAAAVELNDLVSKDGRPADTDTDKTEAVNMNELFSTQDSAAYIHGGLQFETEAAVAGCGVSRQFTEWEVQWNQYYASQGYTTEHLQQWKQYYASQGYTTEHLQQCSQY
jgi:hypothetical protein